MTTTTKRLARGITLIGAGSLASALGPALRAAGYRIDGVAGRSLPRSRRKTAALARKLGAKACELDEIPAASHVFWLCIADDALAETANLLAHQPGWKGRIVIHSSGALTSDVLAPLRAAGAHVASLHPMMTFVGGAPPRLAGVPFAVEGDRPAVAMARKIVRALKAEVFPIAKKSKVLYHALGSFSSPLLLATLVTAERIGDAAGLTRSQTRKVIGPIVQQTIKNFLAKGGPPSFSGPIKRGDLNTIRGHLKDLKAIPGALEVYRALVKSALIDLPAANREQIRKLLE